MPPASTAASPDERVAGAPAMLAKWAQGPCSFHCPHVSLMLAFPSRQHPLWVQTPPLGSLGGQPSSWASAGGAASSLRRLPRGCPRSAPPAFCSPPAAGVPASSPRSPSSCPARGWLRAGGLPAPVHVDAGVSLTRTGWAWRERTSEAGWTDQTGRGGVPNPSVGAECLGLRPWAATLGCPQIPFGISLNRCVSRAPALETSGFGRVGWLGSRAGLGALRTALPGRLVPQPGRAPGAPAAPTAVRPGQAFRGRPPRTASSLLLPLWFC